MIASIAEVAGPSTTCASWSSSVSQPHIHHRQLRGRGEDTDDDGEDEDEDEKRENCASLTATTLASKCMYVCMYALLLFY